MGSKSSALIVLVTAFILLGLGSSYFWTQANPLAPQGTTIIVTTELDTLDDDGLCSLREAIQAANTDSAVTGCDAGQGADLIVLASGAYTLTIAGTDEEAAATGDLDITNDLEIRGQGSSLTFVSGNSIDRVFHVDPTEKGIQVEFVDLTIQDGDAVRDEDDVDIKGGGGILTHSEIILDGVDVINNRAHRGGGIRITSLGQAKITDSTIQDNSADREGGGIYGDGSMDLDNVQIINNQAARGGGVFCDRICDFLDVSISENLAPYGGGVYSDHILNLTNVTIDHNGMDNGKGGGIFNQAEITLVNTTVSSNIAAQGSGIYSEDIAYLKNVTMYQNSSNVAGPGLVNDIGATLELVNTIIANSNGQPNCAGDFISLGHNLAGDNSCDFAHATDIHNTDPLLGLLGDNGGKTQTHALKFDSPAVDAGSNYKCTATDQRSFTRPMDGDGDGAALCDIGAYELAPGGILRIDPVDYTIDEGVGTVQLSVQREGAVGEVSVRYFTWEGFSSDRANQNADYIGKTGTLTWADGDDSIKYINIEIVDDPSRELDEIFYVMLSGVTGGAGIDAGYRVAVVTIQDNDPPPALWATPVPEPDRVYLPLIND